LAYVRQINLGKAPKMRGKHDAITLVT
jgi:hypothetical protein